MNKVLFENLTKDHADNYGLVLDAYHLPYAITRADNGWQIWVDETVRDRALELILKYIEENNRLILTDDPEKQAYNKTFTGIWVCVLLLVCHFAVIRSGEVEKIIREYGASAFNILNGEFYRTITSLMLHSDYPHLAGNIAGIGIFGTAVCSITGPGAGWLMILLSGILGNLTNAAMFRYNHISIGASTSVFGAIGILAAYQLCMKIRVAEQRMKAWLPMAGGVALLGILGSGRHSDITAHLFGFLAGVGLGTIYTLFLSRLLIKKHQIYCMAVTISIVALSWSWRIL